MNQDIELLTLKEHIELADLCLVSCLVASGFPVLAFNKDPKEYPKIGMIFKKTTKLEETISRFWAGSLLIEPKLYWQTIRELKSRMRTSK